MVAYRLRSSGYSFCAPLLVGAVFTASAVIFGTESFYVNMAMVLGRVLAIWAVLIIPGFYLARLLARRALSADVCLLIAPLVTIACAAFLFLCIYPGGAPRITYAVAIVAGLSALLVQAVRTGALGDITRVHATSAMILGLAAAASVMALLFSGAGFTDPQTGVISWEVVAKRYLWPLPCDNKLQYDTATVFLTGAPPWKWDSEAAWWTMGDRPPLMGILNAVYGSALDGALSYWDYQVNGTILNTLFLLPLGGLAMGLFRKRSVALGIIALSSLHTYIFMNLYFTWPKTAGLYCSLCALLIATARFRGAWQARFALAGAAAGLGSLFHAGAILSLPALCAYIFCITWRRPVREKILSVALFAAIALALQAPWAVYKKVHPEIDTNKLMYHYMPDEFVPKANYSRNIRDALARFFRETPLEVQIRHRLDNVKRFFAPPFQFEMRPVLRGNWSTYLSRFGEKEFAYPLSAIGAVPISGAAVLLLVRLLHALRRGSIGFIRRDLAIITVLSIALISYLLNIAARWGGPGNHELPFLELCVLMLCIWGYCWRYSGLLGVFLLAAAAFRWLFFTITVLTRNAIPVFDLYYGTSVILALVIALVACAATCMRAVAVGQVPAPRDAMTSGAGTMHGIGHVMPERAAGADESVGISRGRCDR